MSSENKQASYRRAVNPNSREMRKKNQFDNKLTGFRFGHEAKKGYGTPQNRNFTSRNAKIDCPACDGVGQKYALLGELVMECGRCRGFGWIEHDYV